VSALAFEEFPVSTTPVTPPPSRRREAAVRNSFRVRPSLWDAAKVIAAERKETVTDVLVGALEAYVKEDEEYKAALATKV
jgi:hypothetical protein